MSSSPGILSVQLAILLPIALGYALRHLRVFDETEVGGLRKFVMKVGIPFMVFNNLLRADVQSLAQAAPIIVSFALVTVLFTVAAHFTAPLVSVDPLQRAAYSCSVFAGNYAFLGWGVIASFYGEQALTRAVFFTMFFWPVFLLTGFWLDHHSKRDLDPGSRRPFLPILIRNAGVPLSASAAAILMNVLGGRLPVVLDDFVRSVAAIGVPLILFSIGLSLRVKLPRSKVRIVVLASVARLIVGFVPGLLVVVAVRMLYPLDPLSQKVVLMQAVMPTATMATFFMEYVPLDGELLSAAITFSTIASLFTLPFWFWVIQRLV